MTKLEKTIITKCFEHFLCKISTFLSMSFYNLETLKLRKQIILILSCKNISFIFLFSDLLINFSKRLVLLLILQFRNSSLFSLVALFPYFHCHSVIYKVLITLISSMPLFISALENLLFSKRVTIVPNYI